MHLMLIHSRELRFRSFRILWLKFVDLVNREKMVEGRLGKIAKELALLEQPFIKDNTITVGEHIKAAVATIGENIQVLTCAY